MYFHGGKKAFVASPVNPMCCFFLIVLSLLFFSYVIPRLALTETDSIKPKVLWRTYGVPKKGDYVEFYLPEQSHCPLLGKTVSKQIICSGGDYLQKKGDRFFCNGVFFAEASRKEKPSVCGKGDVPDFAFDGVIPEGLFFVFGSHPLSYDSRYWGLVSRSSTRKLIALF